MVKFSSNTEKKVFEAAKKVFISKGYKGARMQEIADEAGINKALLHYYFRTKEKLFKLVFENTFQILISSITGALDKGDTFEDKIKNFTETYIIFLLKHPHIIQFILNVALNDIKLLKNSIQEIKIKPKSKFVHMVKKEIEKGTIKNINPEQLIINIISLSIFPFLAKPMLMILLEIKSEKDFIKMIEERKKLIPEFVITAIKN